MTSLKYDVVAVGNAIVDVLKPVPESVLAEENIAKAGMTLIDEDRADHLTARFDDATIAAGGSAANTMTGVASFGGAAGYIGKVAQAAGRGGPSAEQATATAATAAIPKRWVALTLSTVVPERPRARARTCGDNETPASAGDLSSSSR
jgi:hypothetical protein